MGKARRYISRMERVAKIMHKLFPRKVLGVLHIVCFAVVGSIAANLSYAGTVQFGSPVVTGSDVQVPVVLQGDVGAGVAAMDFRFTYDPSVLQPVGIIAGQAAAEARKTVSSNMVSPGEYVVVLFGMNQSVIQAGEVVTVAMKRVGEAASGESQIAINQTTLASLQGQEIASEGSTGTVSFTAPPTQDNGETPDPPVTPGDDPGNKPTPNPADPDVPDGSGGGTLPRFVSDSPSAEDDADKDDEVTSPSNDPAVSGLSTVPSGSNMDSSRAKLAEASDALSQRRSALAVDAATVGERAASLEQGASGEASGSGVRQAPVPATHGSREGGLRGVSVNGAAEGLKVAQAGVPGASEAVDGTPDSVNAKGTDEGQGIAWSGMRASGGLLAGLAGGAIMLGAIVMLLRKRLFT